MMIDPIGDLGSATHASCGRAGTSDVRSLQLTVAADGRSATVLVTDSSGASVLPIYRLSE